MLLMMEHFAFSIVPLIKGGTSMSTGLFVLLICGLLVVVFLVLFLPARGSRSRTSTSADGLPTSAIFRDDKRYWYGGGLFYYNPDDPEVFVPKRFGFGRTVNFGHPLGMLVMFAIVLLGLALALLKTLSGY
jgi:uncharacterized membrane protein